MQDSDPTHVSQEHIDARNSQGSVNQPSGPVEQVFGDQIAGDKVLGDKVAGDKVLGTKIVIEAEKAYDVRGLANPYLGLRAFTYADRAAFAGREGLIEESVARMTAPGEQQALTFITGASGSGKSSFAQAGLLPALEAHYQTRGKTTRWAVFRPGTNPLASLADALLQLGLPEINTASLKDITPQQLTDFFSQHTPANQINLLIIDQFEETFTQSPPDQGKHLIALLCEPPPFEAARTHLIATLRSDYLDWLFEVEALWELASRHGIGLRAMDEHQLKAAILKPLQAGAQSDASLKGKQFEPALVERLAGDASADAAYLPLLQVTLQEIWDRGLLKLSEYSGLAEAISRRAERVYRFSDFEAAQLSQERPAADQQAILSIFLDLVSVSLDDDPRRDVRRWQLRHDFETAAPERPHLVEQLLRARLLNLQVEGQGEGEIERVSIIHEALIARWERLKEAIQASRDKLRRRARFELDLNEWQQRGGDLLSGARLADALALQREQDPVVGSDAARRFLVLSQERFVAQQRDALTSRRRERTLRGLAAGALAFGLLFLITYWFQVSETILLLLGVVFMATVGAAAGWVFNLGLAAVRERLSGSRGMLAGGGIGSLAFTFPLLTNFLLLAGSFNSIGILLVLIEALVWGFFSGASAAWAMFSRQRLWMRLAIPALASGIGLVLGEAIGHGFTLPGRVVAPSLDLVAQAGTPAWVIFIVGAGVQLILLIVTRLVVISPAPPAASGS